MYDNKTLISIDDLPTAEVIDSENDNLIINTAEGTKKVSAGRLGGGASSYKTDVATLAAGETTLTFEDTHITTASSILPWADKWGIVPVEVTVNEGQCVIEFNEQDEDVDVFLEIRW